MSTHCHGGVGVNLRRCRVCLALASALLALLPLSIQIHQLQEISSAHQRLLAMEDPTALKVAALQATDSDPLAAAEADPDASAPNKAASASLPSRPSYAELRDKIKSFPFEKGSQGNWLPKSSALSAYSRAKVFKNATLWFPKRKMCKETCCVETVAISLDQDKHKIINGRDGRDVADIILEQLPNRREFFLQYHGSNLQLDMLPCLLPGTILFIQNHDNLLRYFWHTIRPKIQVPYTLVVSGTDGETPSISARFWNDPLLQKYYGVNPKYPTRTDRRDNLHKYQSLPLGLGTQYPQEKHLLPYLKLTNFTNPFLDKNKWDLAQQPLDFDQDVFVHFRLNRPHRKVLWNILCPNSTNATANTMEKPTSSKSSSCQISSVDRFFPIHDIYTDMSQSYRFGISPVGFGFDIYRTYELLLLGIIPVVEDLNPEGYDLLDGLPVVHMPHMREATSQQDFVDAIQKYIASDAFQKASFGKGWAKLFLQYKRQQLLKDTGRDQDILMDETGRQYYQAFHYSVTTSPDQELTCSKGCDSPRKPVDAPWLDDPVPKLSAKDQEWMEKWTRGKAEDKYVAKAVAR